MDTITRKWKPIEEREYMHEVIWPNNKHYNRLRELQDNYPKLTYQNKGYEYLDYEIRNEFKEQLDEITDICKETVAGFSRFNHFKLRADGTIVLRLQYVWSRSPHFTGVGYFDIDYWNEKIHKKMSDGTNA